MRTRGKERETYHKAMSRDELWGAYCDAMRCLRTREKASYAYRKQLADYRLLFRDRLDLMVGRGLEEELARLSALETAGEVRLGGSKIALARMAICCLRDHLFRFAGIDIGDQCASHLKHEKQPTQSKTVPVECPQPGGGPAVP